MQKTLHNWGDFNIIRFPSEKNKMGGVHKHTGVFNSIINTFELIDLHMNGASTLGPITR
jgi:hypothetical protein